ncbi:MAG: AAA family ATPase [Caldilineaceae bacterium]
MSRPIAKRIPYGSADFGRMRTDNSYYVDKTRFIPVLEAQPYFVFLIRPRRFGKTLWLSTLQHYYDINRQAQFEQLFGGTYIGDHPTAERNSYLVMFFNFALVNPSVDKVEASFEDNGYVEIASFLRRYERFFTESERQAVLDGRNTEARLRRIFDFATEKELKIYLLIDEYDNFANTVLTTAGQEAYHNLTHGEGFFRHFFNLLKGATAGQIAGLSRLYITGVSPVTMDDVTSGFNIGDNLSIDAQFNELVGFTEAETRAILEHYHQAGALQLDVDFCLETMQLWYDGYCFAKALATQPDVPRIYNSTLVWHFVKQAIRERSIPYELIDANMRIDYGKLRYLLTVDGHLNGNFGKLRSIIETGEVASPIVSSFPLVRLTEPENFISQLLFFGLLTFAGAEQSFPLLRIPNRTIQDLLYSYLREGFRDADVFRMDIDKLAHLTNDMAYGGAWQAFFDYVAASVKEQASIRDYLGGEKVIQGFLLAYLNVTHLFLIWSEKEMGGGFVDFYLEPFLARYRDMQFGYLVELKYIRRSDFNQDRLARSIAEAESQLARYADDPRIQQVAAQVTLKKLVLVFSGWELVYRAEAGATQS